MPEAPVYEDGHFRSWPGEVRPTWQIKVPAPPLQPSSEEDGHETEFSAGVALTLDGTHDA